MTQLNSEDLLEEKVWGPELSDPKTSFKSEYRPEEGTSSQTCIVGRKVSNAVNFQWKSG